MIQEYIVYAIILGTLAYIIIKFSRKVNKKKVSACDGCSGCSLKEQGIIKKC